MREITSHVVAGNEADTVKVVCTDLPGAGGACHWYEVRGPEQEAGPALALVQFQNGPIKEAGINGVTHEALLAIIIDRLEHFQAGPFASNDNEEALFATRKALSYLQKRTRERIARGVEGKNIR